MIAPHAVPHRASLGLLITAGGCIFATGLAALVYEVCWIRKASLAFGSATWALSAVLAVFFAGLAFGGYVVGRLTPRLANPLRAYAWLEMGVGVLAILSPALFALTDAIFGTIYPHVLSSVPLLAITRLIAVAIVIFPATTLMGGSLPLFCRRFVRRHRHV
ncbi:MAG: hypothetical protein FJ276_22055, partial [Planctomycetes bacterium]|nr:hypothetical protein [Planctomycetota bacterium]